MAEKLSLLIFSRSDTDKALALIDDMYDHADEIVLVDSSGEEAHKSLIDQKRKKGLEKLKIFYAIALGYPDPLRMYALKKCAFRWVMLIDTDERICSDLKKDLKKILGGAKCSAFALKRYEQVVNLKRGSYYNWQIRIFRKDKTEFGGMIHEEPVISGSVQRLDESKYFMDHVGEIKGVSNVEYSQMERFRRMSYGSFNETMVEYLYKYTMPGPRESNFAARWAYRLLTGYEIIKRKKPEQELSNFDYFLYYFIHALATAFRSKSILGMLKSGKDALYETKLVSGWKTSPSSQEEFEISKILHTQGLIKFLDLSNEKTIKELNKKYKGKQQGIGLLMNLLKERYRRFSSVGK